MKIALAGHLHRRYTCSLGQIPCEVLANCFFTDDDQNSARYYLARASVDGRVRLEELALHNLKLLEPADHVPTVQIQSPADGVVLRGQATFSGSAADDHGVRKVEFSVDMGPWQGAELDRPNHWVFTLNTQMLPDTHHMFRVRAVDSAGQPSIVMGNVLALVENRPVAGEGVFRFQQGRNGYEGCTDGTVRKVDEPKKPSGENGERSDLECWVTKSSKGVLQELNEFYIRFDLSKASIPSDARIKGVTLTLYGSRQNHVDPAGKACGYRVAVMDEPWQPGMKFSQRPAKPGWVAATQPDPEPAMEGDWPYLGGTQQIWPPKEVVIDLSGMKDRIEGWLWAPASNCGLVFSPASRKNYNMSAKGTGCPIVTLRPRLEIEIEPAADAPAVSPR